MVYAVNRPEGIAFAPADAIDPTYGERLREVSAKGVEIIAVRILHEENASRVGSEVAVELG
jgi:sugar fermentation stimulation protein A